MKRRRWLRVQGAVLYVCCAVMYDEYRKICPLRPPPSNNMVGSAAPVSGPTTTSMGACTDLDPSRFLITDLVCDNPSGDTPPIG